MASRSVSVIRGGKKPLLLDCTSNFADRLGVVVPMPTDWAEVPIEINNMSIGKRASFIRENLDKYSFLL